jgi:hypothetical protein
MLIDAWMQSRESEDGAALVKAVSGRLAGNDGSIQAEQAQELARTFIEVTLPRYRQLGILE